MSNPTADREDFSKFAKEIGVLEEKLHELRPPVPALTYLEISVEIGPSEIEGLGVFAKYLIHPSDTIAPIMLDGKWTATGMRANHSPNPNGSVSGSKDFAAIEANRYIAKGEEITIDYRQVKQVLGVQIG